MPGSPSTRPRSCCGGRATESSATSGSPVSAERGYLRETGNLVFHSALVGMLITVGIGGGFGYTGQRVIVQGEPFTNVLSGYDAINQGRFFSEASLEPYSLRLDEFDGRYELDASTGQWHPTDYEARVSVREPGGDWTPGTIKVNSPLTVGGTEVYLLGNGYAPVITVRDADGEAVFSGAVPFLPLDANLRSRGVVKVPDGLDEQLGMQGFFYPDPIALDDGTYASFSPTEHGESLVTLFVYAGDLGLDTGVGVNAYTLDIDGMTQLAGGDADLPALELTEGETVDLPDGLGTIEFEGLRRFISVDIHHDPTPGWALLFAALILGGLLVSLFVPRRRMWVKAVADGQGHAARVRRPGARRGPDARGGSGRPRPPAPGGPRRPRNRNLGWTRDRNPRRVLARRHLLRDRGVRDRVRGVRARPEQPRRDGAGRGRPGRRAGPRLPGRDAGRREGAAAPPPPAAEPLSAHRRRADDPRLGHPRRGRRAARLRRRPGAVGQPVRVHPDRHGDHRRACSWSRSSGATCGSSAPASPAWSCCSRLSPP